MNAEQPGLLPHQTGICPFCGTQLAAEAEHCEICGSRLDPLSRQQAQNQMGPWFVRDPRNPFFPGRSLPALLRLAESGELRRETIIRGPTTRQFWRRADQVPGVAHHVGVCHVCNEPADPNLTECNTCGAEFPEPDLRLDLGLAPMRSLPKVGGADPQSPEAASLTPSPPMTGASPAPPQAPQATHSQPETVAPVQAQVAPSDPAQDEPVAALPPRRGTKRGGSAWIAIGIGVGSVMLLAVGGVAYTIWGPGSGDRTQGVAIHEPAAQEEEAPVNAGPPPAIEAELPGSSQDDAGGAEPEPSEPEAARQVASVPEVDPRSVHEAALRSAIRSAEGLSEEEETVAAEFPELERAARIRRATIRASEDLP